MNPKDKVRLIIREAINQFFEAIETSHFKERTIDRLDSEFTNFKNEKSEIKSIVYNGIEFLKNVNFPGQDNIGIRLLKGPNIYKYHKIENNKIEHSEGNFVWAVIRANDLETIVFGDSQYVPKNTQIGLLIENLINYINIEKNGDFNLTEKDLRKLQMPEKTKPTIKKKENVVMMDGVKWVVDRANLQIYKKNNPNVKYEIYKFIEALTDESKRDEILAYLI